MTPLHVIIPGHPVAKQRPRVVSAGPRRSSVRTYTPKKTAEYESRVRACVGQAAELVQWSPLAGPVEVTIRAHFKDRRHGDLDNVVKSLTDAMNRVAYCDDKQVRRIDAEYAYDANRPRAEVWIRPIDEVTP